MVYAIPFNYNYIGFGSHYLPFFCVNKSASSFAISAFSSSVRLLLAFSCLLFIMAVNLLFGEIVRKQFSGITDKHGVEIYEGDVLVSTFGNGLPFVIKFGEYHDSSGDDDLATAIGFYILEQDGTESLFGKSVNGDTDCYQVIGNVFQNLSTNHL